MLRIHREGRMILTVLTVFLVALNLLAWRLYPASLPWTLLASVPLFAIILQFFRNPRREIEELDPQLVYAPADGSVVVIEEVMENEYFKDKRLLVSIFMSPFNVHVNRNPVSGTVRYFKYHSGKYLVAWHPKSSELNERTTVVYDTGRVQILMRQIAGALAKRIKWYVREGQTVEQGDEMGFIKFGSRVDLFLPLDAKVEVELGKKVYGNETIIARLP
jgi:phosphatidylserine decarboxylase